MEKNLKRDGVYTFPFTGVAKRNPLLMKNNGLDIKTFIK